MEKIKATRKVYKVTKTEILYTRARKISHGWTMIGNLTVHTIIFIPLFCKREERTRKTVPTG